MAEVQEPEEREEHVEVHQVQESRARSLDGKLENRRQTNGVFFFFFSFSRTCDRFIGKMVRSFFFGDFAN